MSRDTARRDSLLAGATDVVLSQGLIGLSLRPLAAELGTSDRMLLYHFGTKDDLVAAILHQANDRAVAAIGAIPPSGSVTDEVAALWKAMTGSDLERCQRVYVEAAALGLFGEEPYVSMVRHANATWLAALAERLETAGVPSRLAGRAGMLLDAALMGFQLDLQLESRPEVEHAVADLAALLERMAEGAD